MLLFLLKICILYFLFLFYEKFVVVLDVLYEAPSLDNDGSYPEFFCSKDAFLRVEDIIESYLK